MSQGAVSGAAVFRPAVTNAITAAGVAELVERGVARLSMESVARRAGTSKSALYRRWPGKVEMVVDVLGELSVPTEEPPSTGSVRRDLRALIDAHWAWLRDPVIDAILSDVLAEARRDPVLGEASERFIGRPRREWGRHFLRRSLPDSVEEPALELVLDLVAAPLYWRLVHDRAVDDAYLDRLVEVMIGALGIDAST